MVSVPVSRFAESVSLAVAVASMIVAAAFSVYVRAGPGREITGATFAPVTVKVFVSSTWFALLQGLFVQTFTVHTPVATTTRVSSKLAPIAPVWAFVCAIALLGSVQMTKMLPVAPAPPVTSVIVERAQARVLDVKEVAVVPEHVVVVAGVRMLRVADLTSASVKLVVAVPEIGPVAVTVYVATNQLGSWNSSRIEPLPSAKTSTSRRQVSPWSSFTRMWTSSPGCQLVPVRITAAPGG